MFQNQDDMLRYMKDNQQWAMFTKPVGDIGWVLAATAPLKEIISGASDLNQKIIFVAFAAALVIFLFQQIQYQPESSFSADPRKPGKLLYSFFQ